MKRRPIQHGRQCPGLPIAGPRGPVARLARPAGGSESSQGNSCSYKTVCCTDWPHASCLLVPGHAAGIPQARYRTGQGLVNALRQWMHS